METVKLSSLNRSYISNSGITKPTPEPQKEQKEPQKDGNKKLKLALAGLAAVGIAIAAGVAIKKGKSPDKAVEQAADETSQVVKEATERLANKEAAYKKTSQVRRQVRHLHCSPREKRRIYSSIK